MRMSPSRNVEQAVCRPRSRASRMQAASHVPGAGARGRMLLLVLATVVLAGGCAARLVPAPGATTLPGRGAGAWNARPPSLEQEVIPMLAQVENGGAGALRVRHGEFALVGADGLRVAARPPSELDSVVSEPVASGFPRGGLGVPPCFSRFQPGWSAVHDPFFVAPRCPAYASVALPTGDMVQLALPETVVEPGGRAAGFAYFERPRAKASRLDFTAGLVDARTGEALATAVIPFVVE